MSIIIRNPQRIVLSAIVTTAVAAFLGYGAYTDPGARNVVVVIEAALAVALVRTLRSGVQITGDGLVIRELLRTRTVPWVQIAAFSPAHDDYEHHTAGIRLTDGSRIRCVALRPLGRVGQRGRLGKDLLPISTRGGDPVNRLARLVDQRVARPQA